MATTPILGIPYPISTDKVIDGENAMQAIAERVEALLNTGRRNVIRNGDIGVFQRGIGPFSGQAYAADGWTKVNAGTGHTVDVVTGFVATGAGINGARCALKSSTTAAAGTSDYAQVIHRVEDVRTLAGRQVTLSFVAYAVTGTPKLGLELAQVFGTGGTPSGAVIT